MTPKHSVHLATLLSLLLTAGLPLHGHAADQTNSPSPAVQQEYLGYDVVDGKSNKISRIYRATPSYVWVIYDGGTGARKIPRSELQSPLKERYPYDRQEAAAFDKEKSQQSHDLADQQRANAYASLLRQERELQVKIDARSDEMVSVQREIRAWRNKPAKTHGKVVALNQLIDKRTSLSQHIESLKKQLEAVRNRQAQYR